MNAEEGLEIAVELYAKMPEDMKDRLRQVSEVACRETGQEATPEFLEGLMIEVIRLHVVNSDAIFAEITEEERHRIIDEEYRRLRADPDREVEETVLLSAVEKRLRQEYGGILASRRPRP